MEKLGDEYFSFLTECADPKACTILLRGGSKDVLNEIERNLADAMQVVRETIKDKHVMNVMRRYLYLCGWNENEC